MGMLKTVQSTRHRQCRSPFTRDVALQRAKVEHPFLYVKRHFGYAKVRYRGVAKNRQRIALLLGFSNLLIAGRYATG